MTVSSRINQALSIGEDSDWMSEALRVAAAFVVGTALRKILRFIWEKKTGREAPVNPSKLGVGWQDALVWGILSGALAGAARVAARRGTDVSRRKLTSN